MRKLLISFAAAILLLEVLRLAVLPTAAITAALAKKCRDMAIKAYPPAPAETAPYAQAEQEYCRECIIRNGEMPDNDSETAVPAKPH